MFEGCIIVCETGVIILKRILLMSPILFLMLLSSCSASAPTQNSISTELSTKSTTFTPLVTSTSATTVALVTFNGFVPKGTYVNDYVVYSNGNYNPSSLFNHSPLNSLPNGTKVGYYAPGPLPDGFWISGRNPGELVDNPPMGSDIDTNEPGVGAEVVGYVPVIQTNVVTRTVIDTNTPLSLSIKDLQNEPWNSKLKYIFTGVYIGAGTDFPDKIKVQDVNSDAVVEVRCNDDPLVWKYIKLNDSITVCGYMNGVDVQPVETGTTLTPVINSLYVIDNTNGYRWDAP